MDYDLGLETQQTLFTLSFFWTVYFIIATEVELEALRRKGQIPHGNT